MSAARLKAAGRLFTVEDVLAMPPRRRLRFWRHATDEQIEAVTEPCDGEAHRNAYIDNCMSCAPLWGRRLKRA